MSDIVEKQQVPAILADIHRKRDAIEEVLGDRLSITRFQAAVGNCLRMNPRLAECTLPSLQVAVMRAAGYGFEPGDMFGDCWLIPRRNKQGQQECNFQIGRNGLLKLAMQHPEVVAIRSGAVFEENLEDFDLDEVTGEIAKMRWRPDVSRTKTKLVLVWAQAVLKSGEKIPAVLLKEGGDDSVEARRKRNPSEMKARNSPWKTDYLTMAEGAVIKKLLRSGRVPRSAELLAALNDEGAPAEVVPVGDTAEVTVMDDVTPAPKELPVTPELEPDQDAWGLGEPSRADEKDPKADVIKQIRVHQHNLEMDDDEVRDFAKNVVPATQLCDDIRDMDINELRTIEEHMSVLKEKP